MRQGLSLEHQQKLHLTVEVKQGISVLGMSAVELSEYVMGRLDENPFLERDERQSRRKHPLEPEGRINRMNTEDLTERMEKRHPGFSGGGYGEITREFPFERFFAQEPTLEEHLEAQIGLELRDPVDILIGSFLIGSIDHAGYLRTEVEEVAARLSVSPERIERVLALVQSCEPAGIGARSLSECLVAQLKVQGYADPLTRRVVSDHLEDLASGKLKHVAKALGVQVSDIQEVYDRIKTLDPRPGLRFDHAQATVWPEVSVVHAEGGFAIEMEDFYLPPLVISEEYAGIMQSATIDGEAAAYLSEKLKEAHGLMRGIDQRKATIARIAECIVALEGAFFEQGIEHLRPLTMVEAASFVGVSESTISRVVNGTYMATPRGVIEMRYFFHSAVTHSEEAGVSSLHIKHLMRNLIEAEDPAHPLSDTALVHGLATSGIDVSRRTVNKYRTSLNIPPQAHRRRYDV